MRSLNVETTTAPFCSVDGCERLVEIPSRGWCRKHYQRWKANGDPAVAQRDRTPGKVCTVCGATARAKLLCERHYKASLTPGPVTDEIRMRRIAFFWANVVKQPDGHWMWQRKPTEGGYGQLRGFGGHASAHAFSYELHVGPVPAGKELDHLCKVRLCCNPEHLEAVVRLVNLQRSDRTRPQNRVRQAAKTHCPRDHAYDEANTYIGPKNDRQCRTCKRDAIRAKRAS